MAASINTVKSPCTGICRLNPQDICIGCGRDIEEIIAWANLPESRQREIIDAARVRLAKITANEPAEKN